MTDLRERLDRVAHRLEPSPNALDRVLDRTERRRRMRTALTSVTAFCVFAIAAVAVVVAFHDARPAHRPARTPTASPVPALPAGVRSMIASNGSLWVIAGDARGPAHQYLYRLDPSTGAVVGRTSIPGATFVREANGALWVSTWEHASLVEVDPATGRVVRAIGLGRVGTVPYLATDGRSIFVQRDMDIVRLDPGSDRPVVLATGGGEGLAYADGSVWAADGSLGTVVRFDARTGARQATIRSTAAGEGAAIGSGAGYVWAMGRHSLLRIDPATNGVTSVDAGSPYAMTEGAGSVWVVDTNHLWKIDPSSGSAVQLQGGEHPLAIAVANGWVWLADAPLVRIPACAPTCAGTGPASTEPFALWPEDTRTAAAEIQPRIASGELAWRDDPAEVALRFADTYFGWRNPATVDMPNDVSAPAVTVRVHPSTSRAPMMVLYLRRLGDGPGWWVRGAEGTTMRTGSIGLGVHGRDVVLVVPAEGAAFIHVELGYGGRISTIDTAGRRIIRTTLPFAPAESGHIVVVWKDRANRAIDVWATVLPAGDFAAG